jgi:hypothetical protein
MNINKNRIPKKELHKNLITGALVGGAFGLLLGIGFEKGILLSIITGMLFGFAICFRISISPPKMRYPMHLLRRILIAFGVIALSSSLFSYLLDLNLNQSQKILAVLIPLAGWTFFVVTLGMAIASLDEMQRRIQTEAIAIAFGGTAILVGGYALFQFAGFAQLNVGVVLLMMAPMWLVGKLFTLWRYR